LADRFARISAELRPWRRTSLRSLQQPVAAAALAVAVVRAPPRCAA
jgi:hypothetical protein